MSKLKEMQDSCAVFAADLKTGNIKWEKSDSFYTSWQYSYHHKTNVGLIRLWLNNDMQENHGFWYRLNDNNNIKLKSTTAKEAAAEALQLVKQEAQKLVDALSESPWTKIDPLNLPKHEEVFAIDENMETLAGILTVSNGGQLWIESDLAEMPNPTHYVTYDQILKLLPKPQ